MGEGVTPILSVCWGWIKLSGQNSLASGGRLHGQAEDLRALWAAGSYIQKTWRRGDGETGLILAPMADDLCRA